MNFRNRKIHAATLAITLGLAAHGAQAGERLPADAGLELLAVERGMHSLPGWTRDRHIDTRHRHDGRKDYRSEMRRQREAWQAWMKQQRREWKQWKKWQRRHPGWARAYGQPRQFGPGDWSAYRFPYRLPEHPDFWAGGRHGSRRDL